MTILFLECWGDASAVGSASGAGSENITFIQDDTQNYTQDYTLNVKIVHTKLPFAKGLIDALFSYKDM